MNILFLDVILQIVTFSEENNRIGRILVSKYQSHLNSQLKLIYFNLSPKRNNVSFIKNAL